MCIQEPWHRSRPWAVVLDVREWIPPTPDWPSPAGPTRAGVLLLDDLARAC